MAEVTANQEMSREEVATYLREFADKLDGREAGYPDDDSDDDSAERVREDRTDAAERLRDDEDTGSGRDATAEHSEHSEHDETTHEEQGRATGEKVTFMVGNESATVNPPRTVDFEMAVDSDSSLMSSGTRETVAFELHWNSEEVSEDDDLNVH